MADAEPTVESLAATHAGFVRALALRFAPAPGLAEDIAQQVFLEFLAKAAQWDLTRDVQPLLAGMTRNVARRCWRDYTHKLPEQTRELAEHIRALAEDQDVCWHDEEEASALRQCLDRLPDKSRQLVELHYFLDLTSVDIAARMAMNADAVRRALFRLRAQLRKCIQNVLARA
jgi:RNA polymerase sigma-70 factor (ECF subfamily)